MTTSPLAGRSSGREVRRISACPDRILELDRDGQRRSMRESDSDQRHEVSFERTLVLGETGCLGLETCDVRTPTERNAPHKLDSDRAGIRSTI